MRDAQEQRDRDLRADTDRTRREGLEVINNIKKKQEEDEREILRTTKDQRDAAALAREEKEKKEKEDRHLHNQSQANGLALARTIRDNEYKNELNEQMANSKEQLDLAEHV
jgi:NCAIR mutase (PurE)-related protein